MHALRFRLDRFTHIAILAMWVTALLPTLSHALGHARGGASAWAEVCTPQGMRLVALDSEQTADPTAPVQAAGHLEHCPFCVLGGDTPPLPPAPAADLALPEGRPLQPLLFLHAPRTLFAWRSAQPRGPPTVS